MHMPNLHPDDLQKIIKGVSAELKPVFEQAFSKQQHIKNSATLNCKEAGIMLNGMKGPAISRLCRKGALKAKKIGKSWAIPPESINEYLKKHG